MLVYNALTGTTKTYKYSTTRMKTTEKISLIIFILILIVPLLSGQYGSTIKAAIVAPFSDELPSENYYSTIAPGFDNTDESRSNPRFRAGGNMGGENDNKMEAPIGNPGFILITILAFAYITRIKRRLIK